MREPAEERITDLHVYRTDDLGSAVLEGLRSEPKQLYPRLLYDERGSLLFEAITEQPEYYPTRLEANLLQDRGAEIIATLDREVDLIELGSGSSQKARILLDQLSGRQDIFEYRPIDISEEILRATAREIQADYPHIQVHGFVADFLAGLEFLKLRSERSKLIMFLGGNLGNFDYPEAMDFLAQIRDTASSGDRILLGLDMDKDPDMIRAAYNDAAGVTREFMLNLLDRINRELGADFKQDGFAYRGNYNLAEQRMEMRLISRLRQVVGIEELEESFRFAKDEPIEMEVSCKYTPARIDWLTRATGLRVRQRFTDPRGWFSLILCEVP
jgi:dimethylhistidine N-methyltransferase